MRKINEYETNIERERRERHSAIRREYLERSSVILTGEVKPNRVISVLSNKYNMSVILNVDILFSTNSQHTLNTLSKNSQHTLNK